MRERITTTATTKVDDLGSHLQETALGAVSGILTHQYSLFLDNCAQAADESEPSEALHDLRVAARRFRGAVRIFKRGLAETAAGDCCKRLSSLSRDLGSVRDAEVWLRFLRGDAIPKRLANESDFVSLREAQEKRFVEMRKTMKARLSAKGVEQLHRDIARLLEVGLPAAGRTAKDLSARAFFARKLKKQMKLILSREADARKMNVEELHRLRKRVRRARYCAEFATPYLGGGAEEAAKLLKRATTALGEAHDMDVHLRSLDTNNNAHRRLAKRMRKVKKSALADFKRTSKRLRGL